MDSLDLRIFRSLGFVPYGPDSGDISRLSPWVIAKKIGADGNTVKLRLRNMRKSGFISYFQIYPNFRLLGIDGAAYLFEVADIAKKKEVIERLSLVDGVTEIHNFIGSQICVDFTFTAHRDEIRRLALLSRLTGCESPEKYYERTMPVTHVELSNTDWRIIKALRYDAFKPLTTVAKELGVTAKTVRRRFGKMSANGAIIVVPVVNPAHIVNTITYTMLVYAWPEKWENAMREIMRIFEQTYFLRRLSPPENAAIHASARTLAETEDNLIRVRAIDGVREARLLVLREIREYTEWLDSVIERRIEETANGADLGAADRDQRAPTLPTRSESRER